MKNLLLFLPTLSCHPSFSHSLSLVILNEVKNLSTNSGYIQILRSAQDDKGGTGVDASEGRMSTGVDTTERRTTTKVDANEGRTIPYKDLWK